MHFIAVLVHSTRQYDRRALSTSYSHHIRLAYITDELSAKVFYLTISLPCMSSAYYVIT